MVDFISYLGEDSMLNYEKIFRKKQHYITIPQIPSKRLFVGNRQINRILDNQTSEQDIYISKYPKDCCIDMVILDFDDKDDPDNALDDVKLLKRFLNRKGLNTVIVRSGRKGFHAYIQIPCHNFEGGELAHTDAEPNFWFGEYVKYLIGAYDGKSYNTLDEINLGAGLKGNIRLIGSNHPRGTFCEIVDGYFMDNVEPNEWDWECFESSLSYAENKARKIFEKKDFEYNGNDLIADNDLQDIFESVLGVSIKRYDGYSYGVCPFHNDHSPSLFIDKEKFRCNSCGTRGNIFTLIKMGLLDLNNDLRVGQ